MELRINSTVKDAQKNITRNDDFLRKGNDNMNKQNLINDGYKHICTQNSKSKMELWARFNGFEPLITKVTRFLFQRDCSHMLMYI